MKMSGREQGKAPAPGAALAEVARRAGGGANMPMGSPLAPPTAGRVIVNPQTGQRMQLRGKQWVPVQ